jgi:cysteine desulfuration protein SufE
MSIAEKAQALVNEFSMFEEWLDKYNYLIELGKSVPPIDPAYRTDQYLIKGCQSRVWLHARMEDGRVLFSGDSDAVITRGIASMLIRVFSGHRPDEILNADQGFVDQIGLKEHLSPTRSNGLVSMLRQIRLYALAFKAKAGEK